GFAAFGGERGTRTPLARPTRSASLWTCPFRLSRSPQNLGFAREHCAPRQRSCLWITIQDPADEIRRQPGEMDQIADTVIGDVFTYRNFCHRLRFACRQLFEPDRCARNGLYDDGVR